MPPSAKVTNVLRAAVDVLGKDCLTAIPFAKKADLVVKLNWKGIKMDLEEIYKALKVGSPMIQSLQNGEEK
jgi:hypothetical protein